jgi:peptidoglycan/xylan/chitin deacetylase (PgdA/CDA1 family)
VLLALRVLVHALGLPLRPSAPRVLLWHSLDRSGSAISLAPELFARQIAWLARRGYVTWPAGRYAHALARQERLPDRLVILTFDDGYANVLDRALPVLRQHGFAATVFLVTGAAGALPEWDMSGASGLRERLLAWSDAESAPTHGLEFESHTHSHRALPAQPVEHVREELAESRRQLAARGLGAGRIIAWPYGRTDARVAALAREEGYVAGFLDDFDWRLRRNPDLFRLNRIPVNPELGVFGVAFAVGKGVELWSWLRDALAPAVRPQRPGAARPHSR